MSDNEVSFHAYRVAVQDGSAPLKDLLEKIEADDVADRTRVVGHKEIRVEDIRPQDGLMLMDFSLLRWEGPGRATPTAPVTDFELDDDDRFAENTAALFDPATGYLVVQYNHRGVRAGKIMSYLSMYDRDSANSYDQQVVYDRDVTARLSRMGVLRKVRVGLDVGEITDADHEAGIAMGSALKARDDLGANFVELEISVKHARGDRGLNQQQSRSLVSRLKSFVDRGEQGVDMLRVTGVEDGDEVASTLNLVAQRMTESFELPLTHGRRYATETRYDAILRVHRVWRDRLR